MATVNSDLGKKTEKCVKRKKEQKFSKDEWDVLKIIRMTKGKTRGVILLKLAGAIISANMNLA